MPEEAYKTLPERTIVKVLASGSQPLGAGTVRGISFSDVRWRQTPSPVALVVAAYVGPKRLARRSQKSERSHKPASWLGGGGGGVSEEKGDDEEKEEEAD